MGRVQGDVCFVIKYWFWNIYETVMKTDLHYFLVAVKRRFVFLPRHSTSRDMKEKKMLIQNLSELLANSVHAMSSLTMVSFLPMIAALMIATIISDRVA